ncbi:DUF6268 family outer membrane beta-barrel protein [Pedobacter sp. Leaf176]|uniref:DUF6268 family outer membrane beta-barrel protein n=1 Tax=Pedobacter sp. Leaf176 TaxID=1736286 RepID=UPI0006FD34B4|nr:DUF6268 family outer membrane beta-barrel protein [Pedobacter sp. Leaf176]KQR66869.1 hypothetical protein ASF92_19140 [Pedobacter sp. Leaf176]
MKIKIALLIAVIWILLRLTSHAQERPSTQNFVKPSLQLGSFKADYTYSPFEIGGAEMSIQQSNASLILPVFSRLKEGKPDFLLSGIAYTGLFLHGNNVADDRSAFHSISVPLTYQKTFSKKHAISFSFIPTLSSDLKDISHEDFIYTGAVSLKVKHSESFVYSLGVVYSRQFFGSLFLPLIGID